MSNGQPRLRTLPPKSASQAEALKRLDALDEWSEQPAKDVAAAIVASQPAQASSASSTAQPTQASQATQTAEPVKASKPAKKVQPAQPQYPWSTAGEGAQAGGRPATRQFNIKVPEDIYLRLKWLGETTYGTNMTQIAIEALAERVASMLKERGIK